MYRCASARAYVRFILMASFGRCFCDNTTVGGCRAAVLVGFAATRKSWTVIMNDSTSFGERLQNQALAMLALREGEKCRSQTLTNQICLLSHAGRADVDAFHSKLSTADLGQTMIYKEKVCAIPGGAGHRWRTHKGVGTCDACKMAEWEVEHGGMNLQSHTLRIEPRCAARLSK